MGSMRILIAIATYNERENLPSLVDALFGHVPSADILVVDDNSPDGTGEWCRQKAREDERLRCIHRSGKLGLGTATVAAMQYALQNEYTYLVHMDADFSHSPHYVPQLLAKIEEGGDAPWDVVIGSRYVAGGRTEGWPLRRRIVSRCLNLYARSILRLTPHDCSGAFRCIRTSTLAKVNTASLRSTGYAIQEEILWHLQRQGARMVEIPIVFSERQQGHSKVDAHEVFLTLSNILRMGACQWLGRSPRAVDQDASSP